MEGCDFVLGPQRVRLSALEVTDLRGWFVAESSQAGMKLGGAVRRVAETGEDVIVEEGMRVVLLAILDEIAMSAPHFTDGLRELREAARIPLTGPW